MIKLTERSKRELKGILWISTVLAVVYGGVFILALVFAPRAEASELTGPPDTFQQAFHSIGYALAAGQCQVAESLLNGWVTIALMERGEVGVLYVKDGINKELRSKCTVFWNEQDGWLAVYREFLKGA